MESVGVVTESTACLPPELVADLSIETVPLRFDIDGRSYRDAIDIAADDIYRLLSQTDVLPTASAPIRTDYYAPLLDQCVVKDTLMRTTSDCGHLHPAHNPVLVIIYRYCVRPGCECRIYRTRPSPCAGVLQNHRSRIEAKLFQS